MWLNLPEPVHACTRHTLYPLKRCSWRGLGPGEPSRTCVKEGYIPCSLCETVGREGSMRFDVLEPHPTSAASTLTPSSPCKEAVREGSVQLNHPKLL